MKIHGTFLLAMALGGCAHQGAPGSVANGECKFLERPDYVVKGKRQYDQDWIDSTIEGGVGGCGWHRPAPRPAQLDAPVAKAPPVVKKKKKPGWLSFVQGLKKPEPPAAPEAAPVAELAPPPPPPPRPLRPVDQLLGGK